MSAEAHNVYVSGPMRGIKNFNEYQFDETADRLVLRGYAVFNPAANDRKVYGPDILKSEYGDPKEPAAKGFDLRRALAADTGYITSLADAVCVLPGWVYSKGAMAEVALAEALGLPIGTLMSFPGGDEFLSLSLEENRAPRADIITEDGKLVATVGGEIRSVSSTGGEKGTKLARYDLIPVYPLRCLAEHFGRGAQKYADRNWERGYEWSKSYAALMRHLNAFWEGEDIDEETGSSHLAAAEWHCMALLEYTQSHPEFDDRPIAK